MKIQHGKWSSFSILWHQDFSPIWGATEPFVSYLIHFFSYDHLIYHFRRLRHYIFWEEHKSTQYSAHMNRKGVVTLICLTLYYENSYIWMKKRKKCQILNWNSVRYWIAFLKKGRFRKEIDFRWERLFSNVRTLFDILSFLLIAGHQYWGNTLTSAQLW